MILPHPEEHARTSGTLVLGRRARPVGRLRLSQARRRAQRAVTIRQGVLLPVARHDDVGLMVTALIGGGVGYAATGDVSERGVAEAVERASAWAARTAGRSVLDGLSVPMPHPRGEDAATVDQPWDEVSLTDKIDLVQRASERLKRDERIVDWEAGLWFTRWQIAYLTNGGGRTVQRADILCPHLSATANRDGETQTRSTRRGYAQQGGMEVLGARRLRRAGGLARRRGAGIARRAELPDGHHGPRARAPIR